MAIDNKGLPIGWGDNNEDDDDYGLGEYDNDDENSAWGSNNSPIRPDSNINHNPVNHDHTLNGKNYPNNASNLNPQMNPYQNNAPYGNYACPPRKKNKKKSGSGALTMMFGIILGVLLTVGIIFGMYYLIRELKGLNDTENDNNSIFEDNSLVFTENTDNKKNKKTDENSKENADKNNDKKTDKNSKDDTEKNETEESNDNAINNDSVSKFESYTIKVTNPSLDYYTFRHMCCQSHHVAW